MLGGDQELEVAGLVVKEGAGVSIKDAAQLEQLYAVLGFFAPQFGQIFEATVMVIQ
ncbi:MAG: hypothetical protein PXY39_03790 [archaeon]|nr:hypothetical protein [archaeon]